MMDCIFCAIVKKEIPNYTVYEDTESLAFLDIHPCTKGHAVVIPKVHAQTLFDLPPEKAHSLIGATRHTMKRLVDILHPDGFSVGWNHGEAGGQAVPHMHIHVLPRWQGDGGGSMHSILQRPSDMSVAEIANLFHT